MRKLNVKVFTCSIIFFLPSPNVSRSGGALIGNCRVCLVRALIFFQMMPIVECLERVENGDVKCEYVCMCECMVHVCKFKKLFWSWYVNRSVKGRRDVSLLFSIHKMKFCVHMVRVKSSNV